MDNLLRAGSGSEENGKEQPTCSSNSSQVRRTRANNQLCCFHSPSLLDSGLDDCWNDDVNTKKLIGLDRNNKVIELLRD